MGIYEAIQCYGAGATAATLRGGAGADFFVGRNRVPF